MVRQAASIEPDPAPNIAQTDTQNQFNDLYENNEILNTIAETNIAEGRPSTCITEATTHPLYQQQEEWPNNTHLKKDTIPNITNASNNVTSDYFPLDTTERDRYQRISTIRIMRQAAAYAQPAIASYRLHLDEGANMSLTNDESKLINFRYIKKKAIAGVADGGPALYAVGIGYLPWRSDQGTTILIKCFYSPQAAETVISPNDVVINHIADYSGWTQYSNVDDGIGHIALHHRNSDRQTTFQLESHNGLWYNQVVGFAEVPICRRYGSANDENPTFTIRYMSKAAEFALLHCRTGHACDETTSELHKHLDDCPKVKKHAFWKCPSCMQEKARARSFPCAAGMIRENNKLNIPPQGQEANKEKETNDSAPESCGTTTGTEDDDNLQPGQMFHMDFGFMRGSSFSDKDDEGRIITSLDGMNSYLIIVDRKTRRTWVFLTRSKVPPIKIITEFLAQNGSRTATRRIIRSDQGGELYKSTIFQETIRDSKFLLEPTGAGAPQQNGLAERPNQTLGNMTRCLLNTANLPPEYWSWALTHAVYLKNRLPHQATGTTPYYAWTGRKPSAKLLRIFGCPVVVKNPGPRPAKLDHHTSSGIFLGYMATDNNIYYRDNQTKRIKIATHVQFDEVSMTIPKSELSPAIVALQELGVPKNNESTMTMNPELMEANTTEEMKVKLLSENAQLPQRATDNSAGYDIFSAASMEIPPGEFRLIPTDITFEPPRGTYGQLLSRSGLSVKHSIDVRAGTIDADYRGNVMVKLENSSQQVFHVNVGDRIAQLVLYYIGTPRILQVDELNTTTRQDGGFGSTGINTMITRPLINAVNEPVNILDTNPIPDTPNTLTDMCTQITAQEGIKPYHIWLSPDPFDKRLNIAIDVRRDHPTLGLITTMCQFRNRVQLVNMEKSTPGARIPKWRSTLRHAYIIGVDGALISNAADLQQAIHKARQTKQIKLHVTFATEQRHGIHSVDGNLSMYFDQMNACAKHILAADMEFKKQQDQLQQPPSEPIIRHADSSHTAPPDPDLGKFFTKKQLMNRTDWEDWRKSQWKQVDQYETQGMFGDPQELPSSSGASFMHWTYCMKMDGTKKARMVCDGARNRSATSVGHTYANSLDAPSERLFWAIVAKRGLIAVGADVSNAFAEAPAPAKPLYISPRTVAQEIEFLQ